MPEGGADDGDASAREARRCKALHPQLLQPGALGRVPELSVSLRRRETMRLARLARCVRGAAWHAGGHAGYEIAPFIPTVEGLVTLALRGMARPCPALNTVQHHDLHHRFPNRHFSLYFTHWDRVCGTLHPSYDAELFWYFGNAGPAEAK